MKLLNINDARQPNDQYLTPDWMYQELDAEFHFDFDPCPYQPGVILPARDGLLIDWGQRNFMNPPFSGYLKPAFVKRAIEFSKQGRLCVCLLPVCTSTALWHDYIDPNATDLRFQRGRIKFVEEKESGVFAPTEGSPRHDTVIAVFDCRLNY